MKAKVPIFGTVGKAVSIETDAPSRTEVTEQITKAVANITPAGGSVGPVSTIWRLIREIPANVVALANLNTAGLMVRTVGSALLTRAIDVADTARLTITNGDGVAGAPTIDMADITKVSVWGRAANTDGKPAAIQAANNDRLLARTADQVTFRQLTVGMVPDAELTYAKLQDVSAASKLLGRGAAGGAGDVEEITLGTNLSMTGTTLNASGGGGGTELPGTTPDLLYWFDASKILGASGMKVSLLQNFCPWFLGMNGSKQNAGVTVSGTQLNSKNVVTFPGSSAGRYTLNPGTLMNAQLTVFAVVKFASFSDNRVIYSGATNALGFRANTSGKFQLSKVNVTDFATSTTTLSSGTWYQVNVTYNASSGAWAFRLAQANDGSGTNSQSLTAESTVLGYNGANNNEDMSGDLAELIVYQRVLSGGEITAIEAYLNSKWGV